MLRYAIAHPDGRLFHRWRFGLFSHCLQGIDWTIDPQLVAWCRHRLLAQNLLDDVQAFEPEARLVEQETEDL